MENLHAMFKFYWRQKQQQAAAQYTKNTLLHEDKKLEQEHPDICDEELEVVSSLFFQLPVNDNVKENKTQRI